MKAYLLEDVRVICNLDIRQRWETDSNSDHFKTEKKAFGVHCISGADLNSVLD